MPKSQRTVVNLGLTEALLPAYIAKQGGGEAAAWLGWDCYRRLLLSYAMHVLRLDREPFDLIRSDALDAAKADGEHELGAAALEALTRSLAAEVEKAGALPRAPFEWLERAVAGGFAAWNLPEADEHRRHTMLEGLPGTALIVQAMVQGTASDGAHGGAGHLHSRLPATGEKKLHGSYLAQAQGEDLTAGVRLPDSLDVLAKRLPDAHREVCEWAEKLERQLRNAIELDFTIQRGTLYLLNALPASRTHRASLKMKLVPRAVVPCKNLSEP